MSPGLITPRPESPVAMVAGTEHRGSVEGVDVVDWSFAQAELLQKTGYDIRKEFEEK